jgi:hypothetical protein
LGSAQNLPLVQAQAEQKEKYFNWQPLKPKTANEDDDPDGWLLGECRESPSNLSVSSFLNMQGKNTYSADKLTDDNPTTAWVGGKPDYGIGEYMEFMAFPLSTWAVLNGYQKDNTTWENNSRAKKIRIFIESKPSFDVLLEDKMGIQTFRLPESIKIDPQKISTGTKIKIQILEVYEGKKYKDVAISEIFFMGC